MVQWEIITITAENMETHDYRYRYIDTYTPLYGVLGGTHMDPKWVPCGIPVRVDTHNPL